MDISELDPRKVADANLIIVRLHHPGSKVELVDDEGKYLEIGVRGVDSTKWRNRSLEMQRAKATSNVTKVRTSDDDDDDLVQLLAFCTETISPNIKLGDRAPKDALELYRSQKWIAKQVIIAATDTNQAFLASEPA